MMLGRHVVLLCIRNGLLRWGNVGFEIVDFVVRILDFPHRRMSLRAQPGRSAWKQSLSITWRDDGGASL